MDKQDLLITELKTLLPEYLAHKQIKIGTYKNTRAIHCLNPQHPDQHPSMRYDFKRNKLHCFSCGVSYDIFELIAMDYAECDTFSKQVRKACEIFGKPYPGWTSSGTVECKRKRKSPQVVQPYTVDLAQTSKDNDFTAKMKQEITKAGIGGEYFVKRGLSKTICETYQLYQTEKYAVIPVMLDGRCISYCARAIEEQTVPRYKNSYGPMGIFNADYITTKAEKGILFITESAFDALSAEQCGFHAVGLCGIGNVKKFLELCASHPTIASGYQFIAAGDRDEAGQKMNQQLHTELLKMGLSCSILEMPLDIKDFNELLIKDRKRLVSLLSQAVMTDRITYQKGSAANSVADLLDLSQKRAIMQGISTGYTVLDQILDGGFYPGLYIFGAVSSIGKTSLLVQMADYIAAHHTHVLYFSLEMSKLELIAKSISRLTYEITQFEGTGEPLTTRQMLRYNPQADQQRSALVNKAITAYQPGAQRLFIREGIADIGVQEIRAAMVEHLRIFPESRPVIMVDYLQILKPDDMRATDKQNTDRNIVALKRLSRDFSVPVVVVSSFNRENYRNVVSMESFKESGTVEYSSDVLIGLQLAGSGTPGFDANLAKQRSPRAVELVMLKNRNGIPFAQIEYQYLAKYSYFKEGKRIK